MKLLVFIILPIIQSMAMILPGPIKAALYYLEYSPAGFTPSTFTATVGDVLTITNSSTIPLDLYTAPSVSHIPSSGAAIGSVAPGDSFTLTFTASKTHVLYNLTSPGAYTKISVFERPKVIEITPSADQPPTLTATDSGLVPLTSRSEYNINSNLSPVENFVNLITENTQKAKVLLPYMRYVFYVTLAVSLILTIGFIQHLLDRKKHRSLRPRLSRSKSNSAK